jgi:hypothetical protein
MFIIKFTGTHIPFYLADSGNATAYPCSAIKFASIEAAKLAVTNGTFQIVHSDTLKFVAWIN